MKPAVVIIGVVLAILGLGLGYNDQSAYGHVEQATCGSPFHPTPGYAASKDQMNALVGRPATDLMSACQTKLDTWRIICISLIVIGVAATVGGAAVRTRAKTG